MNHGSGDMGHGGSCKTSMLWNWYTIDACFLSSSWHIQNNGMFAASCIGVLLLTVLVELLRRMGKEYEGLIRRQFERRALAHSVAFAASGCSGDVALTRRQTITFRASPLQQFIRAVIHALTMAGGYIIMLLVMNFNGYIIICVFIGGGLGKFLCDWLVVKVEIDGPMEPGKETQGIEEQAVCCG